MPCPPVTNVVHTRNTSATDAVTFTDGVRSQCPGYQPSAASSGHLPRGALAGTVAYDKAADPWSAAFVVHTVRVRATRPCQD